MIFAKLFNGLNAPFWSGGIKNGKIVASRDFMQVVNECSESENMSRTKNLDFYASNRLSKHIVLFDGKR